MRQLLSSIEYWADALMVSCHPPPTPIWVRLGFVQTTFRQLVLPLHQEVRNKSQSQQATTTNHLHAHAPCQMQVKDTKKAKFKLGVSEAKLGSAIQETTGVPCIANEMVGAWGWGGLEGRRRTAVGLFSLPYCRPRCPALPTRWWVGVGRGQSTARVGWSEAINGGRKQPLGFTRSQSSW
jgi:hypothetical protein